MCAWCINCCGFVFVLMQVLFPVFGNLADHAAPHWAFCFRWHAPNAPIHWVTESRLNLRPAGSWSKLWRRWSNAILPDLLEAQGNRFSAPLICVVEVIFYSKILYIYNIFLFNYLLVPEWPRHNFCVLCMSVGSPALNLKGLKGASLWLAGN